MGWWTNHQLDNYFASLKLTETRVGFMDENGWVGFDEIDMEMG